MPLEWTDDQRKIYTLLAEGKEHKEIMAAGYDKSLVSKVKKEKDAGEAPPEKKPAAKTKPTMNLGEEGDEITTQVSNYKKEATTLLYIFDPADKSVQEFRHKYPKAIPMFNACCDAPINFKGTFDEWLMAMSEGYLKAAGWEFAIVPIAQGQIYEEFERLLKAGNIELDFDVYGNPKLEVKNGNGEGPGSPGGDEGSDEYSKEAEGEGDRASEAGARSRDDEIPPRPTKRRKREPSETK